MMSSVSNWPVSNVSNMSLNLVCCVSDRWWRSPHLSVVFPLGLKVSDEDVNLHIRCIWFPQQPIGFKFEFALHARLDL